MTEQEAIDKFNRTSVLWKSATNTEMVEAVKIAIKALEEILLYKENGLTPQMVTDLIKSEKQAHKIALENADKLDAYREIGTVEECRDAVEKQTAKKSKEYEDKFYGCPSCGNPLLQKWEKYNTKLMDKKNGLPYCLSCGQRLDWSDEE